MRRDPEAARRRRALVRWVGRALWALGAAAFVFGAWALFAWRLEDPGFRASAARQLGMALAWPEV